MKKSGIAIALSVLISALFSVSLMAAEPNYVINIPEAEATIDGVVSPYEWDDATKMTLNISDTLKWSEHGAGIVGDPDTAAKHTDADFTNTIRFMVKGDYLYYVEERTDSTLLFPATNIRMPYTSDGSIIFFTKEDGTFDSLSILAKSAASASPTFVFNLNGDEANGSQISPEVVVKFGDKGYVMEAKIKLSDIGMTLDELKGGQRKVSYVAVNIYNPDYKPDSDTLWSPFGYQAQYPGIGPWAESPVIKVVAQTTVAPVEKPAEEPVTQPAESKTETTPPAPATGDCGIYIFAALASLTLGLGYIAAKKSGASVK